MNEAEILTALTKILGSYISRKDEKLFFCYFHGHHRQKLSVNIIKQTWRCWICDRAGYDLYKLLTLKGRTKDSDAYAREIGRKLNNKHTTLEEKIYEKPILPKEYRTLTKIFEESTYEKAIQYLNKREVSYEDIVRYKIGYCENGDYSGRVIFPSFNEDGELNFVLGRNFLDTGFAYKHGEYNKDIVFNEYLINWDEPVIIVEGVFDAIVAGFNAIPKLGSSINEKSYFFERILQAPEIYLAFDSDAQEKQIKIAEKLISYGKKPFIINLGTYKDPSVMGKEAFKIAKEKAERISSKFNLMRLKVKI